MPPPDVMTTHPAPALGLDRPLGGLASVHPASAWLVHAVAFLAVAMGAGYAAFMPSGTPADEPSHFHIVKHYAAHLSLPVLGQPGVDYEAQMGPVYYRIAGLVYRLVASAGDQTAFYVLRYLGLLLVVPAVYLSYQITRRLTPHDEALPLGAALFVGLNPSLLSIASGVQNDMLAIVLCLWATEFAARSILDQPITTARAVALGGIVSAAILTKMTALYLVFPIPILIWMVSRTHAVRAAFWFGATVAALSGWWFLRNYLLYGDISAQRALTLYGYNNNTPPVALWRLGPLGHWLFVIEASYWLPMHNLRHLFQAPFWLRAIVGAGTFLSLLGGGLWLVNRRRDRPSPPRDMQLHALFLGLLYATCMGIYVYACVRVTDFAPRTTFPTLLQFGIVVVFGGVYLFRIWSPRGGAMFVGFMFLILMAGNLFSLFAVKKVPVLEFNLFPPVKASAGILEKNTTGRPASIRAGCVAGEVWGELA